MGKKTQLPALGNQFGKPDLERLGLFVEMPYMHGVRYVFPKTQQLRGLNMMTRGIKSKCGNQDGYFEEEFKRLFIGESIKGRGRKLPGSKFKNVSDRPIMPPSNHKRHACPGDHHGTFSGIIEAFSNKRNPKPKYKKEPANFLTSNVKKGGPGYANICLNPYPTHTADRYGAKAKYKQYGKILGKAVVPTHYPEPYFHRNPYKEDGTGGPTYIRPSKPVRKILDVGIFVPTGPAKWQGGCHAGCFEKFPEHQADRKKLGKEKIQQTGAFYPQSRANKSLFTRSILNYNTATFRIHQQNYNKVEPTYIKHLVN